MNFNLAKFETSYGLFAQLPESDAMEIAVSGRSNVGKSSLLNKLFNRKALARVSSVPGKTATINFYSLADDVKLVDLPGYGYAKTAKTDKDRWSRLIGGYFESGRNLVLVVQLVDMRHAPTKDDINMINTFIDDEIPFIVVLTKSDKLSNKQRAERLEALKTEIPCAEDITMITFSSVTGEGVEELREIIEEVTLPDEEEEE